MPSLVAGSGWGFALCHSLGTASPPPIPRGTTRQNTPLHHATRQGWSWLWAAKKKKKAGHSLLAREATNQQSPSVVMEGRQQGGKRAEMEEDRWAREDTAPLQSLSTRIVIT